jgi:ABC-type Zn uptake system ZnuABC Zn-binding protein ZnuA
MKRQAIIIGLLVLSLILVLVLGSCAPAKTAQLKVVTSTSLLTYIVQQVAGDKVDVVNIVPPAQHPGDFDPKPGDIQTLANASLFLLHGWPGEGYADRLVASANNPNLTVIKANVDGNWMIPSVQMAATDRVAGILAQVDSKNASAYQKSAEEYKQRIQKKEADIKARLAEANISQVNVIASNRQADFLQWAGLNVVAQYSVTDIGKPQIEQELVDKGRQANVTLVINNLQDGKDAGKAVAEELGAKNLNLSNFPGGFDNTETWEKAIDYNIEQLLKVVPK